MQVWDVNIYKIPQRSGMSGRTNLEIKKLILSALSQEEFMTYAQLEKKVNTNWKTIREHCKDMKIFGFVEIFERKSHSLNNKPYFEVRVTEMGKNVLRKIKGK